MERALSVDEETTTWLGEVRVCSSASERGEEVKNEFVTEQSQVLGEELLYITRKQGVSSIT